MSLEYSICYKAENNYENWVTDAHWQFLIIPQENDTQKFVSVEFENSLNAVNERSINGYGFQTIRVHPRERFKQITFEANFQLIKKEINPYDFQTETDLKMSYDKIQELNFRIDFDAFLRFTHFTTLPKSNSALFEFDRDRSVFENLEALNHWTSTYLTFEAHSTDVTTKLNNVIEHRKGVCQDFTHLFCALARQNGIPSRYVSGYLHQGNGYFGDSQMHAWAEAYVPSIGWMGFDPTNNIMVDSNHIKVAHGKDYNDCSPLRGIVSTSGKNETSHSVQVSSQQQQ